MNQSCGLLALGAHRCGTSMLAGLLALHGAYMGQTLPPGKNNPKGYWEHIGINEANENMLAHLRISWDWPFVMPPRWQECLAAFAPLQTQLMTPFQMQTLWAIKDPRLCRLLPLWRPFFSRPGNVLRGIVIFRHPESACRSLATRNAMGRRRALALWLHHFVDAVTHLRDLSWIAVDYESMLANPRRCVSILAQKLELGDWPRTPSDETLREFVDPSLCRHPPASPQSDEWLETSCYALYEALKARHLHGPDEMLIQLAATLRAQLDEGYGINLQLIHEVYAELQQLRTYKLSMDLASATHKK